ncbi:MAG: alkaline phosphatase family protein [Nocardioidaceae bacterium]|nr:alkaline phosphatase family protein [Nocardioidaceae bacterium]
MGVEGWRNALDMPQAHNTVVLLVDGLGYDLLSEHRAVAPYLSSLLGREALTCGLPSTTATSLTSLGTGLTPGTHGVVGYTSRIPGTDKRLNSLTWDQPIDPLVWQPYPTMLEALATHGINAQSVNTRRFANTGLTICSQRGVPFHGVESVDERRDVIGRVLGDPGPTVVYAYESTLDHTGHAHGCDSVEWIERLSAIDRELGDLRESLPADTALVITADHGMIDVPRGNRFDLDDYRELRDNVTLIAGEARFRHLYVTPGQAESVAKTWSGILADRAVVVTRDEAESAGWFGPTVETVRPRLGDVMVAALDDFAVFTREDFPLEMQMAGFHGSLTPVEMRVPLLVDF